MRRNTKVIIKSADRVIEIKFKKLPEIGEELIVPYNNQNHLIRITEIKKGLSIEIYAEEID